ncbi:hypothetical protein [Candidatus Palauibacter sp.]|uniref:hypothetical protein n=1 Tax=Candidatus Palauibacter sp. TaxID=3101350 RepID=UPI003B5283AB
MSNRPSPGPNFSHAPACGSLAAIILLIGAFPAAAQSGPAAVVCVGSERQTLEAAGPVRRVITEDVSAVYRVGVRDDDREGMERSLLSELGDPAEASCTWSNPGDSYVVIIRYTGAIRRDLTLDPDDPRFQAFAVGYGASAEAAEENATRVDARFVTFADESGYEVLVAESWAAAAAGVQGGAPAGADLTPGTEFRDCDTCPRMVVVPAGTFTMGSPASEEGRWDDEVSMAIENMTLLAVENGTLFGTRRGGTGAERSERIWSARITESLRVPSAPPRPPGRRSGGWPWRVPDGVASGSCCPGC